MEDLKKIKMVTYLKKVIILVYKCQNDAKAFYEKKVEKTN